MTTTYLRCYYRISVVAGSVSPTYEWALKPGTRDYYQVPGYWFDGSPRAPNMFYTDVKQSTLASVCEATLSGRAGGPFYAADAAGSFNYTIWTNDPVVQGNEVNKLISFGDSLSDTGNFYNIVDWKVPNPTSWYLGRFSNGPVWVEVLARALQLPVYNWSLGGSKVGGDDLLPTLARQVQSWKRRTAVARNYRIENTQFLIWMGANDITGGSSASSFISDMEQGLTTLLDAGATHILILNLPDISRAPAYRGGKDAPRIAKEVQDYNRLLAESVDRLQKKYGGNRQILIYDANSVFNQLLANPGSFGMANATDSCLDIDISSHTAINYALHFDMRKDCSNNLDKWVFWDVVHPTTTVHGIIGSRVFRLLWKLWHPNAVAPDKG